MALNRFNTIAPLYDPLVKLIFGKAHMESQEYFLREIKSRAKILILGGGTGEILLKLNNLKPDCEVFYIEASEKMILLAKKKCRALNNIHFIHGTEQNIPRGDFDVVITNFFLDLFDNTTLPSILNNINGALQMNSLWFITDFVNGKKWWQKFLLRVMYLFFRIICQIESKTLPLWESELQRLGFKKERSAFFFNDFIKSELYQRIF